MEIWFWVWVLLAAILLIAEMFTATFFLLPFAVGAAAAALLEYLGADVGWQWIAFIGVSSAMLVLLRRYANRLTHEPPVRTGVDRLLGLPGTVIEAIDPDSATGRVRVEREEWRAESLSGENIPSGTRVTVERVVGTRLIVQPSETDVAAS
ncbi:MAG: NfeD family protein [Clostridiales bacterium]|nr:NfeD family protein [Clostridiales bacterium]